MLRIQTLTLGDFQVNVFLATDTTTGQALLVDTSETAEVVAALRNLRPVPDLRAILLTHAHVDHAGALAAVQQAFPEARTWLPALERPMFDALPVQGNWFHAPWLNRPCGRVDVELQDGDTLTVGGTTLRFLSAPGHTPGQGCFYDDADVFVGDLLFAGSIGRTDLPMGDTTRMKQSLRKLFQLSGHLRVHSGHGPDTTLADELASNPFLGFVRKDKGMQAGHGIDW